MNTIEQRAAALLDTVTTGLDPGVDHLVAGGVARGRARRRRRRMGTTFAVVAAIGVMGAAANVLPRMLPEGAQETRTVEPATPPPAPPLGPRVIGFDVAKGAHLLKSTLPAGEVTGQEAFGSDAGTDGSRGARLFFEGTLVTLDIEKPDVADPAPQTQCRAQPEATCRALEDGSYLSEVWSEQPDRGRVQNLTVTLYTTDGFAISVVAWNTSGEPDAEILSPRPLLTPAELEAIVTSDVWLDEQQ